MPAQRRRDRSPGDPAPLGRALRRLRWREKAVHHPPEQAVPGRGERAVVEPPEKRETR